MEKYEYAYCTLSTRLDECQGTTVNDDLTSSTGIVSGAVWDDGKSGNALTFDGTDDGVSFGDILDMGTSDRSISLWVKTTSTTSPSVILSKGYSYSNNLHSIYLYNGKIECLMDISGTDRIVNTGSTTVNDGNWHHIALTIQRDDLMKLYLDGVLKSSVDISDDVAVDAQNAYGFYLGRAHYGQYFAGSIDEVKMFDSVLNSDEISTLYNLY